MNRLRASWTTAAITALVAVAWVATATVASAQGGSNEALKATDVGVTAKEIRIAVLADSENELQPGLFQGTFDAMEGFEKYINAQGGLAGRKVVIDLIDSRLDADETRNAIINACENDFAIVGTTSLFVNNIDDMTGCVNGAGAAVGIPDFPVLTTEPVHQCSPVSYPVNPPALDCSTIDDHPQTYRVTTGPTDYYLKKNKGDLSGVFLYPADLKSAKDAQFPAFQGQAEKGIDIAAEFDLSARAQQSAYTPVVQQIKDSGATYVRSGLAFSSTVSLRKEAKLQGVTGVEVWDCWVACYTEQLIEQGGADVEDQYISVKLVPFLNEAKANKMTANFVKYTGKDKVDGFGAQAWSAGVFFRDVVNAVVEQGGNNALTREAVLEVAGTVNDFTADGMIGATDIGERIPSPCFSLLQVRNNDFTRVYPKKKATFDCKESNLVTLELDLLNG